MVTALSGEENVTLECLPSNNDLKFIWIYNTINVTGEISSENNEDSSPLQFFPSRDLHQIVIRVVDLAYTGNYTCIIQGPPGDIEISETISLTVEPGG